MFRGSIVALVTPFRNGAVDEKAFGDLIEWHVGQGTHGVVPAGTTGESATLTHPENERVIGLCVEVMAGRRPVIAGTGSNSTAEAIGLTRAAQKAGADAALVVVPYYNKPTQEGLYQHFKAVHDATDIPIVLYNVPGRTVADLLPDTVARLAELPRVVGIKDASGDITRPLITHGLCGDDFCQLTGEDGNTLGFLAHGGHGSISVTANVAPALCARMNDAWFEGNAKEALDLHRRLMPLHKALFAETSPAPAKHALRRLGKLEEELRLPLVPVGARTRDAVAAAMDAAGVSA